MSWDDAKKQKAIDLYVKENPTPENSVQIVKNVAETLGETPNGVRMILSKAEVYIKSTPGVATSKKGDTAPKEPKIGKADKIQRLSEAISASNIVPDASILDKLTGKAADYFAVVIEALNKAAQGE